MRSLRDVIVSVSVCLLLLQVSTMIAWPLAASCRSGGTAQAGGGEPGCCKAMAPGQTCPMHKRNAGDTASQGGCRLSAGCCADDTGLAATDTVAVLTAHASWVLAPGSVESIARASIQTLSLAFPPDAPPPRV